MEKTPNEELHALYRSLNIVSMIKSRRLRWAGHVGIMEESRSAFKILIGIPAGERPDLYTSDLIVNFHNFEIIYNVVLPSYIRSIYFPPMLI